MTARSERILHALAAIRPARGGGVGDPPLTPRVWRASVIGLHVTFAAVLGLAVADILIETDIGGDQLTALAALAVLAATYLMAGGRAMAGDADRSAMLYLTVLVIVLGVVSWTAPGALFLLFLAYPQIWFLVETPRPGIIWTCLLAVSSGIGLTAAALSNGQSAAFAWTSSVVGLVFSVLMGTWISKVLEQSRQRADLIAQLEATRAELAVLHHDQGVAQERERLAREVHDTLAQGYTSIVMLSQTALTQLDASPSLARDRIELIEEVARENLAEARRVVAAFAPPSLDGSTLIDAIGRLAVRFERETGVPVALDLPTTMALDRDREVVLLRATQEALTNVRRHAGAGHARITLAEGPSTVQLTVTDDGAGFEPSEVTGSGLAGLRSRVGQAGGSVTVDSAPGHGAVVSVILPAFLSTAAELPVRHEVDPAAVASATVFR